MQKDLDHILIHTKVFWEDLRDRRIFVTGGTGFFGSWLLESFAHANDQLRLNAQMVVLTRNPQSFQQKAPHLANRSDIQFHVGDVRDFKFPEGKFSHVIHAATEASAKLNEETPRLMLDTIIDGTRRALDFSIECGAKKFLLTSSGAIYGKQPSDMPRIPEEYSGAPDCTSNQSAYGEGKRVSELLCAIYSQRHGLETKIARCFAFVGPHLPLDVHFAIGNFIRDAMAGNAIIIKGDGTPFRSYLYSADLAIWLWTILFRGIPNRPYNVGSRNYVTIAETAAAVSAALRGQVPVNVLQKADPAKPAQRYVPETLRAQNELNLDEWVKLEDAIRRTAQWHQKKDNI
ncbi:MAG TPA: NAD-dependent epimerase/dehydratase family protein [Verrucomicrobiae bacterium]